MLEGLVVCYQFKTGKAQATFTSETLLTDADGLLNPLIRAWLSLRETDVG